MKWTLDAHHSELMFKVKHLMITTVTGYFKKFSVSAETADESYSKFSAIVVEADVNSVSTNNEHRDKHLKSADFFDVAHFPKIIFTAQGFDDFAGNVLEGNLTIKGITKSISFAVELNGIATDMYGTTKAGFSISGSLSRKEFGLTWNSVTETGNVVLSDEVKFQAEIQLVKNDIVKQELQLTDTNETAQ